ncbi:MAG: hypothetical protein SFW35_01195 [Chitinophagales bacterium]|nr:hypothetical protein [Chitinophagales bacterium]
MRQLIRNRFDRLASHELFTTGIRLIGIAHSLEMDELAAEMRADLEAELPNRGIIQYLSKAA